MNAAVQVHQPLIQVRPVLPAYRAKKLSSFML
jgi:hypothetical protein